MEKRQLVGMKARKVVLSWLWLRKGLESTERSRNRRRHLREIHEGKALVNRVENLFWFQVTKKTYQSYIPCNSSNAINLTSHFACYILFLLIVCLKLANKYLVLSPSL